MSHKRKTFDHGFSEEMWEAGKKVARDAMKAAAHRGSKGRGDYTISYSDLVGVIRAEVPILDLEPHDIRLNHMLGEISTEEHKSGRGMLSVVVVHQGGDKMPGSGFFDLAKSLGRNTKDWMKCWTDELERIFQENSNRI